MRISIMLKEIYHKESESGYFFLFVLTDSIDGVLLQISEERLLEK